jgi:hypothetical protein
VHRRRFPRIENMRGTMRAWAPFHFLLMLEALRDFRRRNRGQREFFRLTIADARAVFELLRAP